MRVGPALNFFFFSPACEDIELYKRMVAFVMAYSFTEPVTSKEDDIEMQGQYLSFIIKLRNISPNKFLNMRM